MIGEVLAHLIHEFLLHAGETLCGLVALGGGELLFEVLTVVGVVGEAHVDGHRELGLRRISLTGDGFVALAVLCDLTFDDEVSAPLDLLQVGVVGEDVFELIVL